jgi:hypothetical protein
MYEPQLSLRLSSLLHELRKAGFRCEDLTYRKVWQGAVEQRYPAHQEKGVWHFYRDNVPTIGAAYGLQRSHGAPADNVALDDGSQYKVAL